MRPRYFLSLAAAPYYFALVCSSGAAPTTIGADTFTNSTDSLVLGDDSDTSRLWVLPPTSGTVTDVKPQLSVQLPVCRSLAKTANSIEEILDEQDTIRKEQFNILKSIDALDSNATDKINAYKAKYLALNTVLLQGQAQIDTFEQKYGNQDGGSAHVLYETDWDKNVATIKASNPKKQVSPVETKQLKMFFAIPGTDHGKFDLTGMPLFKSYTVLGVTYDHQAKDTELVMSDKLGMDLQLTTLGGCYLAYPELFGQDVSPKFAIATSFLYPRSYHFKIKASYNIWEIYKYFQESGRKNSLFNSSTYSNTVEQTWGDSAFKIDWIDQDPESKITNEQRFAITNEIKTGLLADLGQLAALKVGNGVVPASAPGQTGASVISDTLMKTCAPNAYCLAAAVAFKVLDAVFGSSTSKTEYLKTLNVTATYDFNSQTTRMQVGGTNFPVSK